MNKFELLEDLYVKFNDMMYQEVMALEQMRLQAVEFEGRLSKNSSDVSDEDKAKLISMTRRIMDQYAGMERVLKSCVKNGKNAKELVDNFNQAFASFAKAKFQKETHA